MTFLTARSARSIAVIAAISLVASCGLPRVGPTKREIFAGSVQKQGDAFIVSVNERVTRATAVIPALGFSENLLRAGTLPSDVISRGDTLSLRIWENVDDGLFASEGAAGSLAQVQVDDGGYIFIPYAGRLKAAGNTPDALRRMITRRLSEQTPDPQVEVIREAGDGSTVSVMGNVGVQGVFAIERPTRTLTAMLARAGGLSIKPEVTRITLIRGTQRSQVWLSDLYKDPKLDVALRGGDRVLVEADTRKFTALGATRGQAQLEFESQSVSALEAIAQVGGLNPAAADPTGVFVFRNEPAEIANRVLGRDDLAGAQRMVYVLNLTKPNGLFEARDFAVRDGDTIYVTEAPFTQWNKVIAAATGSLASVGGLATTATSLGNIGTTTGGS